MRGEFRTARVNSIDAKRHTAQVQLLDVPGDEPVVSYDLQVLATRPGDYSLPLVGAPVLCVFLDGSLGAGFVIGAIYTESDAAPDVGDVADRIIAANGSTVTIAKDGSIAIAAKAGSSATLDKDGNIDVASSGGAKAHLAADGSVDVSAAGGKDVTVNAGTSKVTRIGDAVDCGTFETVEASVGPLTSLTFLWHPPGGGAPQTLGTWAGLGTATAGSVAVMGKASEGADHFKA